MTIARQAGERHRAACGLLWAMALAGVLSACGPVGDTVDDITPAFDIRDADPYSPSRTAQPIAPRISKRVIGRVGEEIAVRLQSQPGTGYRWLVVTPPTGLDFVGSGTETPAGARPGSGPGAGIVQVFRFKATIADQFRVDFVLERPWEGIPIDRQSVLIQAS